MICTEPTAQESVTDTFALIVAPPGWPLSVWLVMEPVTPLPTNVSCGLDPKYEPLMVTGMLSCPAVQELGLTDEMEGGGSPTVKLPFTPCKIELPNV